MYRMVAAVISNGKKYWPVNVLFGQRVHGYLMKQWRLLRNIWSASKGRWQLRSAGESVRWMWLSARRSTYTFACVRYVGFVEWCLPLKSLRRWICTSFVKIRKISMPVSSGRQVLRRQENSIGFCTMRWESVKYVFPKPLLSGWSRFRVRVQSVWYVPRAAMHCSMNCLQSLWCTKAISWNSPKEVLKNGDTSWLNVSLPMRLLQASW